jgi:hypothetical protein
MRSSPLPALKRGLLLGKIGLAARNLSKASSPEERERARQALSERLADARGLPMKIGQFLATDGEAAYQSLVTSIAPLPLAVIESILSKAWGVPWQEVLDEIAPSNAAASLGQVHRARLKNGCEVAIKVRYPDIADAIAAELMLGDLMPGLGPVKRWGFDLDGYRQTLRENFERELDYLDEATRQHQFRAGHELEGVIVPEVFADLCRENVLVQRWVEGQSLADAASWPKEARAAAGARLAHLLLFSLFRSGEMHGDPHPGNFRFVGPEPPVALVLYDYGCTISVSASRSIALLRLIVCAQDGKLEPQETVLCWQALGFAGDKLAFIEDRLIEVTELLLEPFTHQGPFDAKRWDVRVRMDELLGERKWWFRSAGPPDLFLLLRAFQGLFTQLDHLQVELDWRLALTAAVGQGHLAHARRWKVPGLKDAKSPHLVVVSDRGPKELKISVSDRNREIVRIAMPAAAAMELPELVPEDIIPLLTERQIDLHDIVAQLQRDGLRAHELFRLDTPEKRYRVWLE